MIWNEYAERLKEVLKLEGNPIAVTDEEIEEIEKLVPNGTIVEIRP